MRRALCLPLLALLTTGCPTGDDCAPGSGDDLQLMVPAYFPPGVYWDRLIESADFVGFAIANPASGPGGSLVPQYEQTIAEATEAGIDVLGYVSTAYGSITDNSVEADIDTWFQLYGDAGLRGIFLDEVPGTDTCEQHQLLYGSLAGRVEANRAGALVVGNPGAETCESYASTFDVLMGYEGSAAGFAGWTPPAWAASNDRFDNAVLLHSAGADEVGAALERARSNNVGSLYITDDDLAEANPWDTVSSHWSGLIAAMCEG